MRGELRFLHRGSVTRLERVDPTRTVLEYLRHDLRQCGTKEGCAEGDCGACTVAIGELVDGSVRFRAVNACIQFLGTLDGKALITVEDLSEGDQLHPVQQAMVEQHGSQCGFCTPGFVMSLFTMHHESRRFGRQEIADRLAGNLCRCTGYGPIIAAAESSCSSPPSDQFCSDSLARDLAALQDEECLALSGDGGEFFAPVRLEQLRTLMAEHPGATLLAGGTDVGLWVTKQHRRLAPVIYLGRIAELQQLENTDEYLEIGAGVTVTDAMPLLAEQYPDFGELLRRYGADQVRNQATLGGNIANGSPIGDSPPPLIALETELLLDGPEGVRRMPLEAFFLAYGEQDRREGEFVRGIRVPLPRPGQRFACYKLSKRFDQDISSVCAAFNLILDESNRVVRLRTGFGGMAATPKRALAVEQAAIGKPWDDATLDACRDALRRDFTPIDDLRASAAYRHKAAANLLTRFFHESQGSQQPTRLFGQSEHAHGAR